MLKILIFLLLLKCVANSGQTPYGVSECGLHGRFEYCIDGIPGCVVGCHCHPGFYFDTETKICESSAKMFQDSRRYNSPPLPYGAPQQEPPQLPPPQPQVPLPRSPAQSELLSEITEYVAGDQEPDNEEDLEEWLYRQFSKTIESQILHNNGNKPNRRSGGDSGLAIPTRRKVVKPLTTQVNKAAGKQKKSQPRAIDENDSLFEDASSEEGNNGGVFKGSGEKDKSECKNEGKKMIIIKKAPKMPLPPFIFMPQGDGSYYPANGLAPPPPMTLFPIVPVPPMLPMVPMMPPSSKPNACASTSTTTTTTSTTTPVTPISNQNGNPSGGRNRVRKRKPNPFLVSPYTRSNDNVNKIASAIGKLANGGEEADLLPNVQSRAENSSPPKNGKKKSNGASLDREAADNLPARRNANRKIARDSEPDEPAPGFQYLTDLIHTFESPTKPVRPMNYNSFGLVPQEKKPVSIDDTYFTNLGKEIVTLMNKMDAGSDTDSDGSKSLVNPKVVWDRQVRSPSPKNVKPGKVNSNEELIHLEKDVYAAATSAPALSLAELEEKIRKVDEEFINIESDAMHEEDAIVLKQPDSHLNVNLLESAKNLPISTEKNHSVSLDLNPIQSVLIHSELRHSEPVASALIHFEIRNSDPKRAVMMHPTPISYTPKRPNVPKRTAVRPVPLPREPSSSQIFKSTTISSIQLNNSVQNHHVHLYKNLKPVYKKSKKHRQSTSNNSTFLHSLSNYTQPHLIHKEVKHIHKNPSQVISSAVMHKEPRHSQANYSPPKIHLEHKPHSKFLKNHQLALNNKISPVETNNVTKTSVFGSSYGYNIFQPNDFNIANPIPPSSLAPPSKPPFHQHLSSYEKWEFDKQQFYYPKLTADLNDLNRWRYINEPQILPETTSEQQVNTPEPFEQKVDTYPFHHKLYRQYFFPYAGKGIKRRDYETPSWYFDTR